MIWHNLCLNCNCHSPPWEEATRKSRFAWVGLVMITFAKMQMPSTISTIFTCHCDDWRNGVGGTWVWSCKTWNLTSLAMEAKESRTTSCVTMRYPQWSKQSRCILVESMGWSHMHQERLGRGRFNLVHNAKDNVSNAILKDGMIGQAENQTPKLKFA